MEIEIECKKKSVRNETSIDFGVEYLVAVWEIVATFWFLGQAISSNSLLRTQIQLFDDVFCAYDNI